jgi:hypothetical protein
MNLLITNARVVDSSQELDAKLDVLIEQGNIMRVDKRLSELQMLNVECSMLNVECDGLEVGRAQRLSIQHSTFNIEHSTLPLYP